MDLINKIEKNDDFYGAIGMQERGDSIPMSYISSPSFHPMDCSDKHKDLYDHDEPNLFKHFIYDKEEYLKENSVVSEILISLYKILRSNSFLI